ncbi:HD domain-containing phosphohydrolase [Azotosporobacter soli]|uniref:HD domain-containing phosphohydrolase n=1 Tax=Azotosporobacter soli TaxID=3055040 RepID=UPI0031FE50FF
MSHTPLLLIVDDEENILHAIKRLLSSQPYLLKCTTNHQEALDFLRHETVDVLISDQRMPHMSGMELLGQAKLISPSTVRILLTAYSDFEVMVSAINEGLLFHYISKPWNDESFKESIQKALLWKQEQDEKEYILQQRLSEVSNWSQTISHLQEQVTDVQQRMLQATLKIVELKDPALYHHCIRTSLLAALLAGHLPNYSEQDIAHLKIASLFHDIGKITIKDEVFYSSNRFTEADYNEMKRHPKVGYDILKTLAMHKNVQAIVYQHHERLDGTGYPRGLRSEDIVLGAKILTVADVYDALTSDRPYHKGMSPKEASFLISTELHSHYDATVVDALSKIVADGYDSSLPKLYN